jgi:hypothetical protein
MISIDCILKAKPTWMMFDAPLFLCSVEVPEVVV